MGNVIKSTFKLETFFLDFHDQKALVDNQWGFGYIAWLLYRSITMLYLLVLLIVMLADKFSRRSWKFFIMITHWALILFVLNYVVKFICLLKYKRWFKECALKEAPEEEKPLLSRQQSWIIKYEHKNHFLLTFSWALANAANVLAIFVSIDFWMEGGVLSFATIRDVLNFQTHGVNGVLAVLDLLLIAQPTLLLHFYQPLLVYFVYYSFTAFYYIAGGTGFGGTTDLYIYLNWAEPEKTLIKFGTKSAEILLIHIAMWLIASVRSIIASSIHNKPIVISQT